MTMRSVRQDDRSAAVARYEQLYELHYARVVAYCRRRTAPARVDDAVADTFTVAWRRIDDVPEGTASLMWLYRVAHRVVGHQWRSSDRHERLQRRLAAVPDWPVAEPDTAAISADETERVLRAAEHLNESDAEVLRLLCWERLTRSEIAEVLELTPNAVSQRIHRARKNLAEEFARLERTTRAPGARNGGRP
jgi:RNA polymerase sigma-70 factor (ECF subfamily)